MIARREAPPEVVDGGRALEFVKVLAGDAFGGRRSGLPSGRQAEEWVAAKLEEFGLPPGPGESYYYELRANVTEELPAPRFTATSKGEDDRGGKYLEDFVTLIYSGEGTVKAGVVFAGYGIHEPDSGRDDYEGLDVRGKIVMALRGKPEGNAFEEQRLIGYKSSTAFDRGAVGFVLVEGDKAIPGTIQEKFFREKLPGIWLARTAADDLFRRAGRPPLEKHVEKLKAGGKASFPLEKVVVKLSVKSRLHRDAVMRNVVAVWPGETDEVVLLGAHLDHLGVDGMGNVYNGADDNASGSAMLLEVARAIAAKGTRFRRRIMFVWFAGEDQGLIGSNAFVKKPPIPLGKIAVMLNSDMVGQGKPILNVGGVGNYPRDAAWLGNLDIPGFTVRRGRGGGGSDHLPFALRGVPAFFINTQGPHPNYHTPKDDSVNIKPELLEKAGRFVRALAERAADAKAPFCRPDRKAEYLWNAAPVADLDSGRTSSPELGVDLRVEWFEGDFNAIDETLTHLEAKGAKASLLEPGGPLARQLRDLRPTVILGLRGPSATRLHRPAHRLGVALFAPFVGAEAPDTKDLFAFAEGRPVVVSLDGAPEDLDPRTIPAPILVPASRVDPWKDWLAARKKPWLVVYRLRTPEERTTPTPEAVAKEILGLRDRVGAARLAVVPGDLGDDAYRAKAPARNVAVVAALARGGLADNEIRRLLGQNLVRLLEAAIVRKK